MKKNLCTFMGLALCLGLTACGGSSGTAQSAGGETEPVEEVVEYVETEFGGADSVDSGAIITPYEIPSFEGQDGNVQQVLIDDDAVRVEITGMTIEEDYPAATVELELENKSDGPCSIDLECNAINGITTYGGINETYNEELEPGEVRADTIAISSDDMFYFGEEQINDLILTLYVSSHADEEYETTHYEYYEIYPYGEANATKAAKREDKDTDIVLVENDYYKVRAVELGETRDGAQAVIIYAENNTDALFDMSNEDWEIKLGDTTMSSYFGTDIFPQTVSLDYLNWYYDGTDENFEVTDDMLQNISFGLRCDLESTDGGWKSDTYDVEIDALALEQGSEAGTNARGSIIPLEFDAEIIGEDGNISGTVLEESGIKIDITKVWIEGEYLNGSFNLTNETNQYVKPNMSSIAINKECGLVDRWGGSSDAIAPGETGEVTASAYMEIMPGDTTIKDLMFNLNYMVSDDDSSYSSDGYGYNIHIMPYGEAAAEEVTAARSEAETDQVIADTEDIKMVAVSMSKPDNFSPECFVIKAYVENKTDGIIYVEKRDAIVNGAEMSYEWDNLPNFYPGTGGWGELLIPVEYVGVSDINELESLECNICIFDMANEYTESATIEINGVTVDLSALPKE